MARRCPGCGQPMTPRAIACPVHRKLIPVAVRHELVGLHIAGLWWSDDDGWKRALAAATDYLWTLRRAGTIPPARNRRFPPPRPRQRRRA